MKVREKRMRWKKQRKLELLKLLAFPLAGVVIILVIILLDFIL